MAPRGHRLLNEPRSEPDEDGPAGYGPAHPRLTTTRSLRAHVGIAVASDSPAALEANVRRLAAGRRVQPADHFSLAGLVGETVADLKLHGRTRRVELVAAGVGSRFFSRRESPRAFEGNDLMANRRFSD